MQYDAFISYSHGADGRLAPAVQNGLQRLARPWYRRRALRVFRDATGLAVNPQLWGSIQQALDDSRYFVLLASPEAAASPWVERELRHWLATHSADTVLPVLTDGTLAWNATRRDFDPAFSSAVPAALYGVYTEEPRYLDLRWARAESDLDLRHSGFRSQIAELAAPMHGKAKDELESDDIRLHRRALQLAWAAAIALAALTAVSVILSIFAVNAAAAARRSERQAVAQRKRADSQAELARRQSEQIASTNAQLANANSSLDQSNKHLAAANSALSTQTLLTEDQRRQAVNNANDARRNAAEANRNAAEANRNAADAATQTAAAQRNLAQAQANELKAEGQQMLTEQQRRRGIARQLVLGSNAALGAGYVDQALLLGVEAGTFARSGDGVPGLDTRASVVDALQHDPSLVGYLQGLNGPIIGVAVAPDGTRAAAVTDTGLATKPSGPSPCASCRVGVWSLANDRPLAIFPVTSDVEFVGLVDASTLVVGGPCGVELYRDNGNATSWTKAWTWAPSSPCALRHSEVLGMAVAPSGAIVATFASTSSMPPNRAYVLDRSGHVVVTVPLAGADPIEVAVSPDGSRFAVADGPAAGDPASTLAHVYSVSGSVAATLNPSLTPAAGTVKDLRFSRDGSHVAMLISGASPPVHRFDLATGADDVTPPPSGSWAATVPSVPIDISPSFDRVVQRYSADNLSDPCGNLLGVGYLESGSFVGGLDSPITCTFSGFSVQHIAFSSDGSFFIANGGEAGIPVFVSPELAHPPLASSRQLDAPGCDSTPQPCCPPLNPTPQPCALAPDASLVAYIPQPGPNNISALHIAPLLPTRRSLLLPLAPDAAAPLVGAAQDVTFGNSAEIAVVGFGDGAVELWDTSTAMRLLHLDPPHPCDPLFEPPGASYPRWCQISMTGTVDSGHVAEASAGHVHIWDISRGGVVAEHDIATGDLEPYNLSFISSGTHLVAIDQPTSGVSGPNVHIYGATADGWTQQRSFSTAPVEFTFPASSISPNGDRIAIQDVFSGHTTVYNAESGTPSWSRPLEIGGFSQDGQTLYALDASQPTQLLFVSANTGNTNSKITLAGPLFTQGVGAPLIGVAQINRHIIVVGESNSEGGPGPLQVFDSPINPITNLDDAACHEAGRNLTAGEWSRYVGNLDTYQRTCTEFP